MSVNTLLYIKHYLCMLPCGTPEVTWTSLDVP